MKRYGEYKDSGIEWIGEIPSEWSLVPIKRILSAIQDGTHATFARVADGMPLLSAKNVSDDGVEISESESLISESDYNAIVSNGFPMCGDVLLCCVGTIGRCCIYTFETQMAFQRSVSFLRVNGKMTNRFLLYSLKSIALIRQMIAFANSSAQSGIYMGIVKSLMLSLPPVLIQQQIVTHLDRKTAAIDELIADKQKLVNLLKEKRNSIISEAVTKGLDKTAKMKDSGIEWIGDIPSEWAVGKVGYYYDIQLGKMLQPEKKIQTDTLENYLCAINIGKDGLKLNQMRKMWFSAKEKEVYVIEPDDLVVVEGGDVGTAIIYKGEIGTCYIQNALHRVRSHVSSRKFLMYWLAYLKELGYIDLICSKATIAHFTKDKFSNTIFLFPPVIAQQLITDYLNKKTVQIDSLISDINEQIEKLKEYRQAIISEAVTGKVAV